MFPMHEVAFLRQWLVHLPRVVCAAIGAFAFLPSDATAQNPDTIARVKASIVAVGTYQKMRVPQFRFAGTGFAVGDGSIIATNLHVLPVAMQAGVDPEMLAIAMPTGDAGRAEVRFARTVSEAPDHDLALLKFDGALLPPLALRDSSSVREGDQFVFTGFPIGSVLGLFPATHRAMIAAITPIAIPSATARDLNRQAIRRLQAGAFPVFQLDGTSFPGNSGSPLYDRATGEVVGILNMVFVKGSKESALTQPSGISFAIPGQHLSALISSVK